MINIDKKDNFDLPTDKVATETVPVEPVSEIPAESMQVMTQAEHVEAHTGGLSGLGAIPVQTQMSAESVSASAGTTNFSQTVEKVDSKVGQFGSKIEEMINKGIQSIDTMFKEAMQDINDSTSDLKSQASTMQSSITLGSNADTMRTLANEVLMEIEKLNMTLSEAEFDSHKQSAIDGVVKLQNLLK